MTSLDQRLLVPASAWGCLCPRMQAALRRSASLSQPVAGSGSGAWRALCA